MCEAYWPFNACSFGGECNVTLGVCVCRESFSLSQHMFKDYGLDCAVPNIAVHLVQKGGLFFSIVNVMMLFVTMKKRNYFSRLKDAQNRAKAIELRRCMLLGAICDFCLLGVFARLEFEGVENISYLEDIPYTVFTYTVGIFFWLFVFERLIISAENALALNHLRSAHMMARLVEMRVAGRRILLFLALCITLGTGLTYQIWWRPAWIIVYYLLLSLVICVMTAFGNQVTRLLVNSISEQLSCATLPKASSDDLKRLKSSFERAPRITRVIAAQSLMTTVPAMVIPWLWSWSSIYVLLHLFNAVLSSLALKKSAPRIVKKRPKRKTVPSYFSNGGSRKVSPASATGTSVLATTKTVSKSISEVGES